MESDFRTLVSDDLVDTLGSLLEHGLDKVSPLRPCVGPLHKLTMFDLAGQVCTRQCS